MSRVRIHFDWTRLTMPPPRSLLSSVTTTGGPSKPHPSFHGFVNHATTACVSMGRCPRHGRAPFSCDTTGEHYSHGHQTCTLCRHEPKKPEPCKGCACGKCSGGRR